MKNLAKPDRLILALILIVLVVTVVIALADPVYFDEIYAAEDHLVEYGTAVFLFLAGLVLLRHAMGFGRRGQYGALLLCGIYALLFIVAAGEEISWGQRIIGWETGDYFAENNNQGETNLHNLRVGGVALTRTLFGGVLTACLLIYLVALPLLYRRAQWVRTLSDRLIVPVPGFRHAALALLASLIIAVLSPSRRWEVYELVFSLLALSIFLWPQNRPVFQAKPLEGGPGTG